MVSLFGRATRRIGMTHIRYVTPVPPHAATGRVARVYRGIEADFGMLAPPLALHAAAPDTLAACWLMLRETLLAPGSVDRAAREVVAASVSLANRCPYCVEVHGTTLAGLLRGTDPHSADGDAVAAGRIDEVSDARLRALARWANSGGDPSPPRLPAPFEPAQAAELIGVAVVFHYINRMVNVFLRESPLPPVPTALLPPLRRAAARILAGTARTAPRSAAPLDLLPDAPLPTDLGWAAGHKGIAAAFARASAAIDAGAQRAVPERVRRLVTTRLRLGGPAPGIGRSWADGAVAHLPVHERAAGRLALVTALASYQVLERDVAAYLAGAGTERALLELTSWASLAAARRIGSQLQRTVDTSHHTEETP